MFEKCLKCERIGQDCIPNLMQLPFAELLKWWDARQKVLGWTNQHLADESTIPLGTIIRIKTGDYDDCRYYTIKKIIVALIGGIADEFPCKENHEKELQRMESLEKQVARAAELEKENAELEFRDAILIPHMTTHQLRHSFCTRLMEESINNDNFYVDK